MIFTKKILLSIVALAFFFSSKSFAQDFVANWEGNNRTWIGPEYWANPINDWSFKDGFVSVVPEKYKEKPDNTFSKTRALYALPVELEKNSGGFFTKTTINLSNPEAILTWAGFIFAVHGDLDEWRHVLQYWESPNRYSIEARLRSDGLLQLEGNEIQTNFDTTEDVVLLLEVNPEGEALLQAIQNAKSFQVKLSLPVDKIYGKVGLAAGNLAKGSGNLNTKAKWTFKEWTISGDAIALYEDRSFGPILWTQYSLSKQCLKLNAQFPPVGVMDSWTTLLQIKNEEKWTTLKEGKIDALSRATTFKIENWDDSKAVPYRIVYLFNSKEYYWEGTIQKNPKETDEFKLFTSNCDQGYVFPHPKLVKNATLLKPDLLFFAGDQFYEQTGGYGTAKEGLLEDSVLDYLRKFYLFGWTWRSLLKDIPSVIIPDDHDIFVGNIFGQGGAGYLMPPEFINVVQHTQSGSLPDPYDATPLKNGINVYYTDLVYGGVSFAILEDRKWKTNPFISNLYTKSDIEQAKKTPEILDLPNLVLLGDRQESFLNQWTQNWRDVYFKVILSQTILSKAQTHMGGELNRQEIDLDANGWPQTKRNLALEIARKGFAYGVHGDQHLGFQAHLGVDNWEDAMVAFMAPGSANGFSRAWWPNDGKSLEIKNYTGRYLDDFGNKMTVLAASGLDPNYVKWSQWNREHPETGADLKGSGFGMIRFQRKEGDIVAECYPYRSDIGAEAEQFEGWPIKTNLLDNFGGKNALVLPSVNYTGEGCPIVQVLNEDTGEIAHTVRPSKFPYFPKVLKSGTYTIRIIDPDLNNICSELTGVMPLPEIDLIISQDGHLHFSEQQNNAQIVVYSLIGQLVLEEIITGTESQKRLPEKGMYIIRVESNTNLISEKIIHY